LRKILWGRDHEEEAICGRDVPGGRKEGEDRLKRTSIPFRVGRLPRVGDLLWESSKEAKEVGMERKGPLHVSRRGRENRRGENRVPGEGRDVPKRSESLKGGGESIRQNSEPGRNTGNVVIKGGGVRRAKTLISDDTDDKRNLLMGGERLLKKVETSTNPGSSRTVVSGN